MERRDIRASEPLGQTKIVDTRCVRFPVSIPVEFQPAKQ